MTLKEAKKIVKNNLKEEVSILCEKYDVKPENLGMFIIKEASQAAAEFYKKALKLVADQKGNATVSDFEGMVTDFQAARDIRSEALVWGWLKTIATNQQEFYAKRREKAKSEGAKDKWNTMAKAWGQLAAQAGRKAKGKKKKK